MRINPAILAMLAALPAPVAADAPSRMSPEAKAYLDDVIAAFRDRHINRGKVDWTKVTARAYEVAGDAKTPADTYKAVDVIVEAMGEKHTFFLGADKVKSIKTGAKVGNSEAPRLVLPEGAMLAGGVGMIRVPAFMGSEDQGRMYTAVAQAMLARFAARGSCGTIVDLRPNEGGNMWPMLNGLKALLGRPPYGSFYGGGDASEETSVWIEKDGEIQSVEGKLVPSVRPDPRLKPVAVLIGRKTASSGEFTAMAFQGRTNTRFFGGDTAGYVSANELIDLKDGARIAMTSGWGTDRTGKAYTDKMAPDEATAEGGPTLDAALVWLKKRGCGR